VFNKKQRTKIVWWQLLPRYAIAMVPRTDMVVDNGKTTLVAGCKEPPVSHNSEKVMIRA
jgi:hypothetical protein